jgi:Universal stress protein family
MTAIDISNTGRIVVGVDGSPTALAALRWAVRQAKATGDSGCRCAPRPAAATAPTSAATWSPTWAHPADGFVGRGRA